LGLRLALVRRSPRKASPYRLFVERHPLGIELADRLAVMTQDGEHKRWQLHQAILSDPIAVEMSLDLLDAFDEQRTRHRPSDDSDFDSQVDSRLSKQRWTTADEHGRIAPMNRTQTTSNYSPGRDDWTPQVLGSNPRGRTKYLVRVYFYFRSTRKGADFGAERASSGFLRTEGIRVRLNAPDLVGTPLA
jgi:hypothetical protein